MLLSDLFDQHPNKVFYEEELSEIVAGTFDDAYCRIRDGKLEIYRSDITRQGKRTPRIWALLSGATAAFVLAPLFGNYAMVYFWGILVSVYLGYRVGQYFFYSNRRPVLLATYTLNRSISNAVFGERAFLRRESQLEIEATRRLGGLAHGLQVGAQRSAFERVVTQSEFEMLEQSEHDAGAESAQCLIVSLIDGNTLAIPDYARQDEKSVVENALLLTDEDMFLVRELLSSPDSVLSQLSEVASAALAEPKGIHEKVRQRVESRKYAALLSLAHAVRSGEVKSKVIDIGRRQVRVLADA